MQPHTSLLIWEAEQLSGGWSRVLCWTLPERQVCRDWQGGQPVSPAVSLGFPLRTNALEVFTKISGKLCFPKWLKTTRNKLKSEKIYSLMTLILENTCKNWTLGTSLVVQWLGLGTSTVGGMALIPGQGTKIPKAVPHYQRKKSQKITRGKQQKSPSKEQTSGWGTWRVSI